MADIKHTKHQKNISNKLSGAKIESFLEPSVARIDETYWPSKDDFKTEWDSLSSDQKLVVGAAVSSRTMGELFDETHQTPRWIINKIRTESKVARAIICARMCQLPSDVAKTMYLETVIANEAARRIYFEEIIKLVKSDKEHLKELADELTTDGDGKRDILKQITAYGMQVKMVEEEVRDAETGAVVSPKVLALADPRMAFNAIQELNRMDHEYGHDDKATSSIESQAARVRRLRQSMDKSAAKDAKVVGGIAKRVATRELKEFTIDTGQ